MNEWACSLREFAIELFSLRTASELIRDKYFDGAYILLKDAIEDVEEQTKVVQKMMDAYDRVAAEAGQTGLVTDSDNLHMAVSQRATERADYIIALAKSKMLDDFGEDEAANAVLEAPYLRDYLASTPSPEHYPDAVQRGSWHFVSGIWNAEQRSWFDTLGLG